MNTHEHDTVNDYYCPYSCDLNFADRNEVMDWVYDGGPEGHARIGLWVVVFELESDALIYRLKFGC